jgi:hypothetical protein
LAVNLVKNCGLVCSTERLASIDVAAISLVTAPIAVA